MLRLRKARNDVGLSLAKVAAEVGFSHVFLQEVELGKRALAMKHWAKLAEALGQDPFFVAKACLDAGSVRVDVSMLSEDDRRSLASFLAALAERCST